ncbi:MAG: DUF2240 family protein [Halanaeroarchaeum sp.]
MSLRVVLAAPFRSHGTDSLAESAFVVSLSLDRDWFTPDQAERVVDVGVGEGLLARDGENLHAEFDPETVEVPSGFEPPDELLQERSTFERVLDELVRAGVEKQEAVAGINRLQADLDVAIEAAAVLYARRQGVDVSEVAAEARAEL